LNKLKKFFKSLFSAAVLGDDIYSRKSRWKWYLGILALLITLISTAYTYFLVGQLRTEEFKRMDLYRQSQELFINTPAEAFDNIPENVKEFITDIGKNNTTIPVILTDDRFNFLDARNFKQLDSNGVQTLSDSNFVLKRLNALIHSGAPPIIVHQADGLIYNRIYYDDSHILTLLTYYPVFQFILIVIFIGFGYLAFSASRRSEQNRVWVGMAKETAHQLGTPIAAILGWVDHLKASKEDDTEVLEVVEELEKDVSRLSLVADRFSKIGSSPELVEVNIYEELDNNRSYMQKRAARRVRFDFPPADETPAVLVKINVHLFDWVIENLLRNALDAMENGEGTISARVYTDQEWVAIDISDTGKGIAANKFKTVFKPGFTTKKRGWGLGLSLAKRIIEEYHGGKILVKSAEIGKGTTFQILLPKV
jgi:signal transduction histidine kinase